MASPFSRSLRSLNADSFVPSLIGATLAMLMLLTWLIWFTLAQVTLYEITDNFIVEDKETIIALFPAQSQTQIHPGQSALLRLDVPIGAESATIPAVVVDVIPALNQDKLEVELYVRSGLSPIPLHEGMSGKVEIEVEYVSPAVLVMRATGQLMDAEQVMVSPQDQNWLSTQ
jgi:hypothetical protein